MVRDPTPSPPARPVALITGASSGIGRATAKLLANEGFRTALVARRRDRLDELRTEIVGERGEAITLTADLAVEVDRDRVVDETRSAYGQIDVLINNAGLGWYGYGSDMPWSVACQMVEVNVAAVAHLTLLVLPDMRARNAGHIISVGSIAAAMGAQGVALYGGTKAFLSSFSRALSREMRGSGVHVSLVQVGVVAGTEFYSGIASRPGALRIPAGRLGSTPSHVARRISALIRRPRKVAFVPPVMRAATWVEPLFWWVLDLAGPMHLRREATRDRRPGGPSPE